MRLGLLALALIVWELASPPRAELRPAGAGCGLGAWTSLVVTPSFASDFGVTLWRIASGFALATLVGLPLGLLLGASRTLGEFLEPVLTVMNTVSSTIWAIFALIWFGLSNFTTIFVVFMTAMPLILTNVWQGTRTVNADYIELARTFRMPRRMVLTKIYLPSILRRSSRVRASRSASAPVWFSCGIVGGQQRDRLSAAPIRRSRADRPSLRLDADAGDVDDLYRGALAQTPGASPLRLEAQGAALTLVPSTVRCRDRRCP